MLGFNSSLLQLAWDLKALLLLYAAGHLLSTDYYFTELPVPALCNMEQKYN
jgi:hypothetical protein